MACKTAIPLSLASKRIHNSVDMMVTKAEKMFYNCEYKKCMQILDEYVLSKVRNVENNNIFSLIQNFQGRSFPCKWINCVDWLLGRVKRV